MATIKLYYTNQNETSPSVNRHWELNPQNLFIVEDIEAYLATKSYKQVTLQYIKNELELGITLDNAQVNAQPKDNIFRYVSIQNTGETSIYYYFVKNVIWRSKSAIRIELVMDVLNTFKEGVNYTFKENTKITREHKDRFVKKSLGTLYRCDGTIDNYDFEPHVGDILYVNLNALGEVDAVVELIDFSLPSEWFLFSIRSGSLSEGRMNLFNNERYEDADVIEFYAIHVNTEAAEEQVFRNIDYVDENINPILQNGNAQGNLIQHEKSPLRQNWYLLYRNQNDPSPDDLSNPVECFLIPQNPSKVNSGVITDGRIRADFIEEGKFYYFGVYSGQSYTLSNGVVISYSGSYPRDAYLCIAKSGNKLSVTIIEYLSVSTTGVRAYYDDLEYVSVASLPVTYRKSSVFIPVNDSFTPSGEVLTFNNTADYNTIDGIESVDRSDPKNIKLIKLPYCPYDFSVNEDTILTRDDLNWDYVSISQTLLGNIRVLQLQSLNTKLNTSFLTNNHPLENLYVGELSEIAPEVNDKRYSIGNLADSKLFHSEFYKPTYVYDSFTYIMQLEKVDTSSYETESDVQSFYICFDMTSTINSKFMFSYPSFTLRNAESNFANVMPVARNNEEVLYNVAYISYIKTGYNYDIKNKNIQNTSNYIGLGLSAASIGASLLAPTVPLKVAGIVASFVSLSMSIKNTIVSTMQNENSIKQKLNQTANQTASVQGSDDVDLMSVYAENRLKYYVYQPNAIMRNLLNDLFFYAGYRSERMGLPNHETRVNFDYLECDAVFENLGSIPNDCLEQLVSAFKTGVTYLHKSARTDMKVKWDFRQEYENWERSLLGD